MSEPFNINLGEFDSQMEAALAYDRAAILLYGADADLNFPPEKSAHVTFPPDIMRKIEAAKRGKQLQ
jgi:hypothetical protein